MTHIDPDYPTLANRPAWLRGKVRAFDQAAFELVLEGLASGMTASRAAEYGCVERFTLRLWLAEQPELQALWKIAMAAGADACVCAASTLASSQPINDPAARQIEIQNLWRRAARQLPSEYGHIRAKRPTGDSEAATGSPPANAR